MNFSTKLCVSSRTILLIFCASVLAACSAKYHASIDTPTGYSETKISDTRFRVIYRESDRVSWDQLHQFVLLRSAEIAHREGFAVFDVKSKKEQRIFLETRPTSINMSGSSGEVAAVPEFVGSGMQVDGRQVVYDIELLAE